MNHRLNAKLHRLPQCPECGAPASEPCVTDAGAVRSPHNIRVKLAVGEVTIKQRKPPPRAGLNQVQAKVLRKGLKRALDRAIDNVQRNIKRSSK